MERISLDEARRLALGAQGFGKGRPAGRIDRRHLRQAMARMKLIQLDSVPVLIRTQYLPLYSRLGPYRAELLDEIAYKHDEWFEAWAHEASLLPVESEPLFRWHKRRSREGQAWKSLTRLAREEPNYVQAVLDEVRERGPILTSELSDPRPRAGEWWGSRSLGQLAIDWLFRIGAIGIRRSPSFEKRFDLLERIVPEKVLSKPTPADADAMKDLLCQSVNACGVGTAEDLVDHFRLPKKEAKSLLPELVDEGRLLSVQVEGWKKTAYRCPHTRLPRRIETQALLSPFDPVCWNRDRALRLFNFHYRIEIYVPKEKRVYGYYVLPFLVDDRLVARFDLKTDRSCGVLEVRGAYLEDGANKSEVATRAAAEISKLQELVCSEKIKVLSRGNLAQALRKALR